MDHDRFEYEVTQELWWLEQNQDAEWIKAQEAEAEKRKLNQEERKNGTYGN